jgi:hypothetical protein
MKFFKSAIVGLLAVITLTQTACFGSQQTINSNLTAKSNWLQNADASAVGEVYEKNVYEITFQSIVPEDSTKNYLTANLDGALTTILETSSYNGEACYKFSTELKLEGEYIYTASKKATVNDVVTSEVYFLGLSDKLAPLYSKKSVLSTVPAISDLIIDGAVFGTMDYTVETTYNRESKEAHLVVTCGEKATEGFKVDNFDGNVKEYSSSGTFFDNESLIFIPRAADLHESNGFSAYFYTLSALESKVQKMYLSLNSTNPTSTIEIADYVTDAGIIANKKFTVYNVGLSISNTFSGSAIELFYSTEPNSYRTLVRMSTQLAYSSGKLVYTLKSSTRKQPQA